MDYIEKINLMKIRGAFIHDLKGSTGATKKCFIIPLDESGMFYNDKSVYLDAKAWENNTPSQYGDTHGLKQVFKKEFYQNMSEEERKNIPYIGNMKPVQQAQQELQPQQPTNNNFYSPAEMPVDDKIPF